MRNDISELQERFNSSNLKYGTLLLRSTSEPPNYYPNEEWMNEIRAAQGEVKAREQEIVRKGIW